MRKYILYIRKSSESEDRQVMSLDAQENEMMRIAKRDDLEVVEVVKESHSAKVTGQRPEFNRMIKGIQSGKYNAILTWAPDRISRNAGDLGIVMTSWMRQNLSVFRPTPRCSLMIRTANSCS